MGWYDDYPPYVPVARRRAQAAQEVSRRRKRGETILPVVIEGRTIATTFWGKAWCTNLEGYSDFENRLPRGRTYVRNGSVVDLKIEKGSIRALVSGSELYTVEIEIETLPPSAWVDLKKQCSGKIGSLVELLQGKLSNAVMEAVTHRKNGLFPKPKEISMRCSCPDYAGMCKHLAAVMYGIGHRLDTAPELLFTLRGVDHRELVEQAIPTAVARTRSVKPTIKASDLGAIFDIEIDDAPAPETPAPRSTRKPSARNKTAASAPTSGAAKKAPQSKGSVTKTRVTTKKGATTRTTAAPKASTKKTPTELPKRKGTSATRKKG